MNPPIRTNRLPYISGSGWAVRARDALWNEDAVAVHDADDLVQLASGDLFLHSPIAFDAALRSASSVAGQGPPPRFAQQGPLCAYRGVDAGVSRAVAWASPGVRERARSQGIDVQFQRDLEAQAPWIGATSRPDDLPGAVLDEVVFFYRVSKTLIVADTIMNFEPEKLSQPYRLIARLVGICSPGGGMSPDLHLAFWPRSATCATPTSKSFPGSRSASFSATGPASRRMPARHPARFSLGARG